MLSAAPRRGGAARESRKRRDCAPSIVAWHSGVCALQRRVSSVVTCLCSLSILVSCTHSCAQAVVEGESPRCLIVVVLSLHDYRGLSVPPSFDSKSSAKGHRAGPFLDLFCIRIDTVRSFLMSICNLISDKYLQVFIFFISSYHTSISLPVQCAFQVEGILSSRVPREELR